jgi:glutathione S-transferase
MHLYATTLPSGNAYKVELLLAQLNIKYTTTLLDMLAKPIPETKTPEFLALNPQGRIPLLVLDDGTPLAESNAILCYLAEGTKYFPSASPEDKLLRTQVLQWLFFEQNAHESYVGTWKYKTYWGGFDGMSEAEIKRLKDRGQAAIDVMETHLEGKKWFVGEAYSIADIALYAYTGAAEAVGFSVGANVKGWMERIEQQDGWVRMRKDPTGKNPY